MIRGAEEELLATTRDGRANLRGVVEAVLGAVGLTVRLEVGEEGAVTLDGGVTIAVEEQDVETPSIVGPRKRHATVYVVTCEVATPGSYDEPPSSDVVDLGEADNPWGAVELAVAAIVRDRIDRHRETFAVLEEYAAELAAEEEPYV